MNTYLDCFEFIRATHGLEWQSLVGNIARLTTTQSAGASALTVPTSGANSVKVALNQFDQITIFDGSNSETVQVGSAGAAIGASSIPLQGTLQFAHGVGVAWCSDAPTTNNIIGSSLADQIVHGSAWIESTACNQPLLLTTYTDEQLGLPSMRASFANDGALHFRPRHWPLVSITALSISTSQQSSVSYDTTQIEIDADKQVCTVPVLSVTGSQSSGSSYVLISTPPRTQTAFLKITYSAGYAYASLPGDVKEAAVLVVSDLLAKRHNPIGAAHLASGGVQLDAEIRGDVSGESILMKRAMKTLMKYSTQPF